MRVAGSNRISIGGSFPYSLRVAPVSNGRSTVGHEDISVNRAVNGAGSGVGVRRSGRLLGEWMEEEEEEEVDGGGGRRRRRRTRPFFWLIWLTVRSWIDAAVSQNDLSSPGLHVCPDQLDPRSTFLQGQCSCRCSCQFAPKTVAEITLLLVVPGAPLVVSCSVRSDALCYTSSFLLRLCQETASCNPWRSGSAGPRPCRGTPPAVRRGLKAREY